MAPRITPATANQSTGAVWLLSDIPLLGELFKPARDNYERTELVIFIRPTVVKSESLEKFLGRDKSLDTETRREVERFAKDGILHDRNNDPLQKGSNAQSSFVRTIFPADKPKKPTPQNEESEQKSEQPAQSDDK